jgi:hypothetical protein
MKVFKDWENNDIGSLVIFLGKENIRQKRRMRNLYKKFHKEGNIDLANQYYIQQGIVMEADTIFTIVKLNFNLDKRKCLNSENQYQ